MPLFSDVLKNTNSNAPALDLNDLQVKGIGVFADAAARDALNSNLHTEGYLAIMKDTDTPFIYTGGTWTDAANWAEVKGLWDEDGLGIKYTTTSGSVSILESTRPYQGNIITGLFGSSQSAPGGSRAARKLLHLHEGQLIFSTETNTPISHIEMSNQTHSAGVGGAIGTSSYNMRIHGYHALEFTHGGVNFTQGSMMVSMDMPSLSANTGSISIGKVENNLGGISLPSFGPGTVNTTNYSLLMGGRIRFINHSNIKWDAITQGPSSYAGAGVALSSFNSSNILVAVSSDSNTAGSYGYVGINTHSPSATGPAFEVSSSYAKFNNGLHIGDITATGYAFPTATGALDEILKVDANGDLVFGAASIYPWESTADSNGNVNTNIAINPTGQAHYGNVGIGTTPNGGSGTLNVNGSITSVTGGVTTATGFGQTGSILNLSTGTNTTKVSIGSFSGGSAGSGFYIGKSAGSSTNTNDDAILIGLETGRFISGQAWPNASTGIIGIGRSAVSRLNGSDNIGIGWSALKSSGTATDNTGAGNVAIGTSAGANVTTGGANVFLGSQAGLNKKTQTYNVIIGTVGGPDDAGNTGGSNIFVGRGPSNQSGGSNTTGIENVFLGAGAGKNNTTGSYNVVIGSTGVGTASLLTGQVNVAINGGMPGGNSRDVAILGTIVAGSGTAIGGGGSAATITDGIYTIAIGKAYVDGDNGISMGWNSKAEENGISMGHQAGRYTSGSTNISLGQYANHNVTGSGNISIGNSTLGVQFGTGFPVTSSNNIAMGYNALSYATDNGGDNIALGQNALGSSNVNSFRGADSNNVGIGYRAGINVNGSGNIFLGYGAGPGSGQQNTISNKLYINNAVSTTPLIYGEFDNDLLRVNGNFQRVVYGSTETTTANTLHIRDNTNWATQADATNNTASTGLIGVAQGATADLGLVLFGDVDYTITGNVGAAVYLDSTAGGLTVTAPTASGNVVRVMGHIIGSNKVFFNPSNDWLEIV